MNARIESVEVVLFESVSDTDRDVMWQGHPSAEPHPSVEALLRVRDSDGCEGVTITHQRNVRRPALEQGLAQHLLGAEVFRMNQIFDRLKQAQRGNPVDLSERTLAAVDEALWDLHGRKVGLPVWRLLGGARTRVPAYASTMCGDELPGGLATPQDYANFAVALVEKGYRAIKLHTWFPPVSFAPSPERDIAACAAVREAVGPDIDLMLDGYHWYDRLSALKIGRAIEELGFLWFEEPMNEASMDSYAWLRERLRIPVIGPETTTGKNVSRAEWIKHDAVDILRVGAQNAGGITAAHKTLTMAEGFVMNCEVHGHGAANLNLVASTFASRFYERGLLHPFTDYDAAPPHLLQKVDQLDADGFVTLPERPGLGELIDFEYIAASTVERFELREQG